METTLILLKPDCITGRKAGEVFKRFEDAGFQIRGCKMFRADAGLLREHYAHIATKPFFPEVEAFMSASPIGLVAVTSSSRAVATSPSRVNLTRVSALRASGPSASATASSRRSCASTSVRGATL